MATLSYYGMARHVKDYLQDRYFCQDQHGYHGPGSDALLALPRGAGRGDPESVMRYMSAIHQRKDLTRRLKRVQAHCLVVVGAHSPFVEEAEHVADHLPADRTKFLQVSLSPASPSPPHRFPLSQPAQVAKATQDTLPECALLIAHPGGCHVGMAAWLGGVVLCSHGAKHKLLA